MSFEIKVATYTLFNTNKKDCVLGKGINYLIPIYQRPYSWTEQQVRKLISDIFISFWGYDKNTAPDSMFIGTMQLSKPKNQQQEIIDGQQRLSTFLILLKVLQLKYPAIENLNAERFNWLKTDVNLGEQQKELEALLNITSLKEAENETQNKYMQNALLIDTIIDELIELDDTEANVVFNENAFINHLYSKICFVIIETHAGLSKTLQIFDAINTTGLDLNAGDLFKIRMYEYLNNKNKDKEGGKEVFRKISKLYEKIDKNNKELRRYLTDIRGVLQIYQIYLIAKFKLPRELYSYGVDTFFDRFFETDFNIQQWEHFKNNTDKVLLSLEDLDKLIDIRFTWERKWLSFNYKDAKTVALVRLLFWSRYSRAFNYKFVFLFVFNNDENSYEKMFSLFEKLTKLYLLYSVGYLKSVNRIKNGFSYEFLDKLILGDYDAVVDFVTKALGNTHEQNRFNHIINNNIFHNAKLKNILCRLSALLEEDYKTTDKKEIKEIVTKLFDVPIDIEHIQCRNDENKEIRVDIEKEWGVELNSIGNLVILEHEYNIKIRNVESKKIPFYKESAYTIVKPNLIDLYSENWSLEKSIKRKEKEIEKITDFITS